MHWWQLGESAAEAKIDQLCRYFQQQRLNNANISQSTLSVGDDAVIMSWRASSPISAMTCYDGAHKSFHVPWTSGGQL